MSTVGPDELRDEAVLRGRAVLLMRGKDEGRVGAGFEAQLLLDAKGMRNRIVGRSA